MNNCPEGYAELAIQAEQRGDYAEAAEQYWNAKAVSIGHNRRARYEEAMERCQALAQKAVA